MTAPPNAHRAQHPNTGTGTNAATKVVIRRELANSLMRMGVEFRGAELRLAADTLHRQLTADETDVVLDQALRHKIDEFARMLRAAVHRNRAVARDHRLRLSPC
jgi:hypothetical protein